MKTIKGYRVICEKFNFNKTYKTSRAAHNKCNKFDMEYGAICSHVELIF